MGDKSFDQNQADEFAEQLIDMLNQGAMALMTSIGHRTGLFDSMAGLPPSTSGEIAAKAGLNERYVREWLGAMVVGGMVDHQPDHSTYSLPAEHAAFLTRAAAPDNIAAFAQYIPLLGGVEDGIVKCFTEGGGIPYSGFPRFQEVMAEDSGQTVVPALLDRILPLVPGLKDKLASGIDVLDVGCGSGRAVLLMAKAFPNSRFKGYDLSEEGTAGAQQLADSRGLSNARFQVNDVVTLNEPAQYDFITAFDAIHDQAHPDRVLEGIAKALRPGGTYLMQDIRASSHLHKNMEHPVGPFLYTVSCMHCMTVSLAANGAGLGAMWGEEKAIEMLNAAGFSNVTVNQLEHDFQNSYYVVTK